MYALKRGGAATAAAASASSRSHLARRSLCLARHSAEATRGRGAANGAARARASVGQGLRFGGAINGGLRRRPLGVSAIGVEGVGRGMASWTPGSQRYGAVVVGEPCCCCCWCLLALLFCGVCWCCCFMVCVAFCCCCLMNPFLIYYWLFFSCCCDVCSSCSCVCVCVCWISLFVADLPPFPTVREFFF